MVLNVHLSTAQLKDCQVASNTYKFKDRIYLSISLKHIRPIYKGKSYNHEWLVEFPYVFKIFFYISSTCLIVLTNEIRYLFLNVNICNHLTSGIVGNFLRLLLYRGLTFLWKGLVVHCDVNLKQEIAYYRGKAI